MRKYADNHEQWNWDLDAENKFLSHTKMKQVNEMRLVRKPRKDDSQELEKYSLWKTGWGAFSSCNCFSSKDSRMGEELGVGVSVYFKLLKNMFMINLLFTILSIPAFILFWHGNDLNNTSTTEDTDTDLGDVLAAMTLANLGEGSSKTLRINSND